MSYKEIEVGLNNEMLEKLAEDYVKDQPVSNLRFCKALNPDEIKKRYVRRMQRYNEEINRNTKKRGRMVWLSKMPFSYFMKFGNWGDSKFTYDASKDPYPFTLKPRYELVQTN
jgi:hypothetical protein